MSKDIVIGSIGDMQVVVQDANNDGVMNEGDQVCVKDRQGRRDCSYASVQPALSQLGVNSISRGIQIHAVAGYLELLRQANVAAQKGDLALAERTLGNAREYARAASLPIDDARIGASHGSLGSVGGRTTGLINPGPLRIQWQKSDEEAYKTLVQAAKKANPPLHSWLWEKTKGFFRR